MSRMQEHKSVMTLHLTSTSCDIWERI